MRSDATPTQTRTATPVALLTALPTPRVWSMLVTIFGDLAREHRDRIDGQVLTRLTTGMGIKPEAVRVALHRLRNDDWIVSAKTGRTANHALTDFGRRESAQASSLIYAPLEEMPKGWQVALTHANDAGQKDKMQRAGFAPLAPRIFLAGSGAKAPEGSVTLTGRSAPNWLRAEATPTDLTAHYAELLGLLRRVSGAVTDHPIKGPTDIAILRCLIVHHWRRLVLRHPYLPPGLTGADWPGHLCRQEVTALLLRLPRPSLTDLRTD